MIEPRTVTEAVPSWELVWREQESRLPRQARHPRRSVAGALGEHFGPVGASNLDPELLGLPSSDVDRRWPEAANEYLAFVSRWLSTWRDDPRKAHRRPLPDFDGAKGEPLAN